jgi:hypothetical protein
MSTNLSERAEVVGDDTSAPEVLEFLHSNPFEAAAGTAAGDAAPALQAAAGRVSAVAWSGTRKNGLVNVSAKANLAWIKDGSGGMHLGLLVTINGDIHNPHVFVGIDVPFSVEVMVDGVQEQSFALSMFAGAVLDPQGSDRWYSWKLEADEVDPTAFANLNRIALQITI